VIAAVITGLFTIGAVFVGGAFAGPRIGLVIAQPTVTITATGTHTATSSGTPAPSQAPPSTAVSAVYWQGGLVGITGAPGGINFDLKPATTSADPPTNISFGSNTLENAYTGNTMLMSQWTGAGQPTHAQCANWALSNPAHFVNNVAEGMQICIRTAQGRIGRLTVTSISPDQNTLHVMAVIWN
jgi:hypothetical protein